MSGKLQVTKTFGISQLIYTMQIYKGFRQTSSESVQTFLQRVRDVAEEAYGTSSSWSMSQASRHSVSSPRILAPIKKYLAFISTKNLFLKNSQHDEIVQNDTLTFCIKK